MIGKITIGKDFYGVLAYNEKKVSEGVGYVIDSNIEHSSSEKMTQEFNLIRQLRPGLGKAVLHVSLNLPHSDQLNDKEFAAFGCDYLMKLGFDNNQFIMYRHTDTKHEHIHIVANRVRYSGRLVSDSNIKRKSRNILNDLEKKYGLTQTSKKASNKKSLTQKEIEKTLRTGEVPVKLILQKKLDAAISNAKNMAEFIKLLQEQNVHPKFNVSQSTGRVSGVSFKYGDIVYKGSSLGRKYSWNNIIKYIDYEQNRDRAVILQTNAAEQGDFRGIITAKERAGENPKQSKSTIGRAGEIVIQPADHLGLSEKDVLGQEPFNNYKNELDGPLWRKRRKKGRKR